MCDLFDAFALYTSADAAEKDDAERMRVFSEAALWKAFSDRSNAYAPFCEEAMEAEAEKLYLPTLDLPDALLDRLIAYTLERNARLAVSCSATLTDAGRIDARFGKSPVMLLHEFGVLGHATVIGGVYLDKDDLSLMAQEDVSLTVLPTADAGYGNGIAPVCSAVERGVRVRLGSGDGVYNRRRDIVYEAAFLRMALSAHMNKREAVSLREMARMCVSNDADGAAIERIERKIQTF